VCLFQQEKNCGGWFDLIPSKNNTTNISEREANNYTAYLRHRLNRFDSMDRQKNGIPLEGLPETEHVVGNPAAHMDKKACRGTESESKAGAWYAMGWTSQQGNHSG
jgi:hypothetical protein